VVSSFKTVVTAHLGQGFDSPPPPASDCGVSRHLRSSRSEGNRDDLIASAAHSGPLAAVMRGLGKFEPLLRDRVFADLAFRHLRVWAALAAKAKRPGQRWTVGDSNPEPAD
jgi:hypothetical protein